MYYTPTVSTVAMLNDNIDLAVLQSIISESTKFIEQSPLSCRYVVMFKHLIITAMKSKNYMHAMHLRLLIT